MIEKIQAYGDRLTDFLKRCQKFVERHWKVPVYGGVVFLFILYSVLTYNGWDGFSTAEKIINVLTVPLYSLIGSLIFFMLLLVFFGISWFILSLILHPVRYKYDVKSLAIILAILAFMFWLFSMPGGEEEYDTDIDDMEYYEPDI